MKISSSSVPQSTSSSSYTPIIKLSQTTSSFIIQNGRLQPRQKDYNVPNYRIIPYKSSLTPTNNDYYTNTISELQSEIQRLKTDYRNVIQTLWRILGQTDRTHYDPLVQFAGLKVEEIYDKITIIRNINIYEPEQQSLKLSAIIRVEDVESGEQIQTQNNMMSFGELKVDKIEIKNQSLYEIKQEEECQSSKLSVRKQAQGMTLLLKRAPSVNKPLEGQDESKQEGRVHRRSLSSLSNHKIDNRRSSLLLREKISLALNEQQQLRVILQQELQKMTKQLDQKNEYLHWTVDEIKLRNQLIEKLRETLLFRDELIEKQQQQQVEKIQEKDKEIGLLINQLIERTQQTSEDFEYLQRSLRGDEFLKDEGKDEIKENDKEIEQGQNEQQEEEVKNDQQSLNLDDNNKQQKNQTIEQVQNKINKQQGELVELQLQVSEIIQSSNLELTEQSITSLNILQPKKLNNPHKPLTLLTKEHFIQAEQEQKMNSPLKGSKSDMNISTRNIENVKMIESINMPYNQ